MVKLQRNSKIVIKPCDKGDGTSLLTMTKIPYPDKKSLTAPQKW
jgi:hypothetical protein